MTSSPYSKAPMNQWLRVTDGLVDEHPLSPEQIVETVFDAWHGLFSTSIGKHGLKIGEHIFPKPQIIGALLHELVPAEFVAFDSTKWRAEQTADDKDIVYIPDDKSVRPGRAKPAALGTFLWRRTDAFESQL